MEIYQIRYFMQIVKTGSMSKAAKELYVSQPAISQAMRKLEEELSCSLFDRSDKMLRMTEAGRLLYVYAERIIYEVDSFYREFNTGEKSRILNIIGYDECFEHYLLPQFIIEHPDITTQSKIVPKDIMDNMLKGSNVDIAITSRPFSATNYVCKKLLENETFVLIPRNEQLSRRNSLHFSELKGLPFIIRKSDTLYQTRFNQKLEKAAPTLKILYQGSDTSESYMQLNKDYCFFTNSFKLLKNEIYPYHRIIKLDEDFMHESVYLTYKSDSDNPCVQEFLSSFSKNMHDLVEDCFYHKNGLLHIYF